MKHVALFYVFTSIIVQGGNEDEDEEREQEVLAKRFAKRARMQRLIETHGEEEEFTLQRLIDEDETIKMDLETMKDGFARAQRQVSYSSKSSSSNISGRGNSQSSNMLPLSRTGSLSISLRASQHGRQKTSFLGGNAANKENVSRMHKSVAISHVVFCTENSQHSRSNTQGSNSSDSGSLNQSNKRKREVAANLWQRVSANGFRKKDC
mmetsp:Transcript_24171/g.56385  ORF Transcript_24171/g.56385 Transcript_24171/m.56385 type:complete len:208 (+) Transcript_24171:44-667(+)